MQKNRRLISTGFAIPIIFIAGALALGPNVHAQTTDFVLASTPSNLCVNPGVDAISVISVQSIGGFTGTINLSSNIDPTLANGPGSSAIPSTEALMAGQTFNFNLAVSTTTSTPIGIYYVTVSGLSGASFHQATVQLTVSSSCSVGGSVLPLDRLTLLSPYIGMAALSGALVVLITALVAYRRRTTAKPTP